MTPVKYLGYSEILQIRNPALIISIVFFLPKYLDIQRLTIIAFLNLIMLLPTIINAIDGHHQIESKILISELAALNMIILIILLTNTKSAPDIIKSLGKKWTIYMPIAILIMNTALSLTFTANGYRTHVGEILLPFLLYVTINKGALLKNTGLALLALIGNSRGYFLSIMIGQIAQVKLRLMLVYLLAVISIMSLIISQNLIRNINLDLIEESPSEFINIATSGRFVEINELSSSQKSMIYGEGLGTILEISQQEKTIHWSHSIAFNLYYKFGIIGIIAFAIIFYQKLKPRGKAQFAYLLSIFIYANLDFSILLNPAWVLLYRAIQK